LRQFESLLLTPATILGMPAEAGLNQKNSTSARLADLGTQTAFDFYPPKTAGGQAPCYSRHLYPKMLNGARKNLSNFVLNFVTYLWDTTLEAVSKIADRVQWQGVPWVESGVRQSALADEQYISSRGTTQPARHREPLRRGGRAIGR